MPMVESNILLLLILPQLVNHDHISFPTVVKWHLRSSVYFFNNLFPQLKEIEGKRFDQPPSNPTNWTLAHFIILYSYDIFPQLSCQSRKKVLINPPFEFQQLHFTISLGWVGVTFDFWHKYRTRQRGQSFKIWVWILMLCSKMSQSTSKVS